ncbi:MAG: putative capsid assembly protease C [Prokaryotic dsDNA virus sp.]|jgi:ATP-dependent protease ClpP protease subunit|nr:MAG: putative capsid assembly protease C [Prokaryotic dsDNA virus sp.]|tara:strand:+ start:17932 stop:18594 length:663 start_codon:yes stop_codon:yes gene_type:complete
MEAVYFEGNDSGGNALMPRAFVASEITSKVYEYYLDYLLEDFDMARPLCTLLRGAEEHDTVIIRINSGGGRFDIAAQIMNAIRECKGGVVGVIEQECASAATMIFLTCNQWQVQPYGEMMIHNASYGTMGKSHEVASRVKHTESMFREVVKEVYEGFLTEEEIELVLEGKDYHFTQKEILDRLDTVIEVRTKEQEELLNEESELEETDQCPQVCEDSEES